MELPSGVYRDTEDKHTTNGKAQVGAIVHTFHFYFPTGC